MSKANKILYLLGHLSFFFGMLIYAFYEKGQLHAVFTMCVGVFMMTGAIKENRWLIFYCYCYSSFWLFCFFAYLLFLCYCQYYWASTYRDQMPHLTGHWSIWCGLYLFYGYILTRIFYDRSKIPRYFDSQQRSNFG